MTNLEWLDTEYSIAEVFSELERCSNLKDRYMTATEGYFHNDPDLCISTDDEFKILSTQVTRGRRILVCKPIEQLPPEEYDYINMYAIPVETPDFHARFKLNRPTEKLSKHQEDSDDDFDYENIFGNFKSIKEIKKTNVLRTEAPRKKAPRKRYLPPPPPSVSAPVTAVSRSVSDVVDNRAAPSLARPGKRRQHSEASRRSVAELKQTFQNMTYNPEVVTPRPEEKPQPPARQPTVPRSQPRSPISPPRSPPASTTPRSPVSPPGSVPRSPPVSPHAPQSNDNTDSQAALQDTLDGPVYEDIENGSVKDPEPHTAHPTELCEAPLRSLEDIPQGLETCTVTQLASAMHLLKLQDAANIVSDEYIDGRLFMEFTEDDLKTIFTPSPLEFIKLKQIRNGWRPKIKPS